MTNLPPSGFGAPGAPMDTLATANPTQQFPVDQVPRAESFNLVGQSALGAQARIVALESLVNTQRAQLDRAGRTALYVESAATNAQDGVNGPAGLAANIASGGIDLRIRFQWPAAASSVPIGMGITPGSGGYNNVVFRVVGGGTGTAYLQLFSTTGTLNAGTITYATLGSPTTGQWLNLRFTWNPVTNQSVGYISPDNGVTWNQVATSTAAAFTLFTDPTAILATWGNWSGGIAWAQLYRIDGTALASVDFTKPWHATTWTDPQGNVWTFRRGGGAWFNQAVPGQISQRIEFTASGNVVVPAWAMSADLYCQGGGGGGGGGGSASTIANQAGGAGGSMSVPSLVSVPATPQATWTITVGTGGTGATGGAAGGAAGGTSGNGGTSAVQQTSAPVLYMVLGVPGAGGNSSAANSAVAVAGSYPNSGLRAWNVTSSGVMGASGMSGGGAYSYIMGQGGSGGGAATATNGGGAGMGTPSLYSGSGYLAPGAAGAGTDANGVAGISALVNGAGGGGGGGGAPTGAGGAGGNGGPGRVIITFRGIV